MPVAQMRKHRGPVRPGVCVGALSREAQSLQDPERFVVPTRRHVKTGELAGHTTVGVHADQPGYGFQYDTSAHSCIERFVDRDTLGL
jgi:hypothetical protein